MTGPRLDVAVVGDGPAGLALAAACGQLGLAVAVIGEGRPWTATYGMWVDDVPDLPAACFEHVSASVVVQGRRRHVVARPYGIVDDERLRRHLVGALDVRVGRAHRVQHFTWGSRVITATDEVDARLVVDAGGRGSGPAPAAWQTAYGIVVDVPPPRFDDGRVTLMDLRAVPTSNPAPTFCYVVPVADGWLVEETALAARPAVDPASLRERLIARLGGRGGALVESACRVETVVIPMGGGRPDRRSPVVGFGAAAGYTHPATGFSVAASLRAAPRVAAALAAASDRSGRPDPRPVWEAVWPRASRRTRRLHDHGLEVLLRLRPDELTSFFDAFFDLPAPLWAAYLRIDAPPGDVSRAMTAVLRRLPGPVRRRVLTTSPWPRRRGES